MSARKPASKPARKLPRFGDFIDFGGDLVCFWRGRPMYLSPYLGPDEMKHVPSIDRCVRVLCGARAAAAAHEGASKGEHGLSLRGPARQPRGTVVG